MAKFQVGSKWHWYFCEIRRTLYAYYLPTYIKSRKSKLLCAFFFSCRYMFNNTIVEPYWMITMRTSWIMNRICECNQIKCTVVNYLGTCTYLLRVTTWMKDIFYHSVSYIFSSNLVKYHFDLTFHASSYLVISKVTIAAM